MMISTRGRYAVRIMVDIAMNQEKGLVTMKDISRRQQISKKYGDQIGLILNQAGFLVTTRGRQGGYHLADNPDKITILQILRCVEGPVTSVQCLESEHNPCERQDYCMTLPLWIGLNKVISDYLGNMTLQSLIDNAPPQPELN